MLRRTGYLIDANYPVDVSRRSSKNEDGNLPLKNSVCRRSGELCPNLPKSLILPQKITVDNHARFIYQIGYWFRLIDASVCGAKADGNAQFAIFDSTDPEKQPLIFYRTSGAVEHRRLQEVRARGPPRVLQQLCLRLQRA